MHPQQPRFRLNRQAILLGIISATFPVAGYCVTAGRADFVIGNVEAVAADGTRRPLAKGSDISAGEAINTAAGARAQVRFADGGYVSLQPNTLFRVDQFNYQNKTDGNEQGFFSLLKGGLRASTGAIGRVNRSTYKVATPSATIGIRGTGYKAEIRDDGLFVSVGEGAISLTNNVGLLVVTAGNAAFVANINTAPASTTEQPRTPPASIQPLSSPAAIIVPNLPSMASGPGYAVSYAYMYPISSVENSLINQVSPADAIFSASSQLIKFSDTAGASGALGSATVTFSATDGIIGWGRWDGTPDPSGTLLTQPTGTGTTVFHYVVGIPTTVMPTTGTATYNLMGYTNPTATDGSTGYSVSGTLSVTFGPSVPTGSLNMGVTNSSFNIGVNGSISISGNTFTEGALTTTGCGTCSTTVKGFFAGANAERVGMSYSIQAISPSGTIDGVAAFAKQ